MRYVINLVANVATRQPFNGRGVTIMSIGVASGVDLTLYTGSDQDGENFGQVGRDFSIWAPDVKFSGAELLATVNCTVEILVTNFKVEVLDGANVTFTPAPASLPLPVHEKTAATVTDNAGAACTAVIAQLAAANAARLELRFANVGVDPVALGVAGLTWAKRVIVVNPGDVWVETRSPQLAWYGICDALKTASVPVQELVA